MSVYIVKIELSNGEKVSGVRVVIEVENEFLFKQYTNDKGEAIFETSFTGEVIVYVGDQVKGTMFPGCLKLTL